MSTTLVQQAANQADIRQPDRPSAEAIQTQLAKILDSALFIRSERLRRFLRVAVDRALAGETEGLKEYALGRDVFDRDEGYDPRVDSIVRVEATRLRKKIGEYYRGPGSNDPVVIEFRRGGYVPVFTHAVSNVPQSASEPPPASPLNSRTVAVLPFVNLSPDPDQDFFCDGITEEILITLTTIPELNVVARTSVFHFKGKTADVREIGRQLGAGTVIEGSVRKADNRLRIAAQAIDASSGVLIWSGAFDREVSDVFEVQSEIARAIAESLRLTLASTPEDTAVARSCHDLEAYTMYLRGRHYWNKVSREGIQAALNEFTQAISLSPDYAAPYAALAEAYGHMAFWGVIPPGEGIARAREAALAALRLDQRMASAYAVLGVLASCDWKWEEAARLFQRAIELQPSNSTAQTYYALYLIARGHFPEALAAVDRCSQLDPLSPWSFRTQGWYYYFGRQYNAAIDALKKALALDGNFREAQYMLALAYLRESHYADAIALLLELPPGGYETAKWGALGEAYGYSGNLAAAEETLEKLAEIGRTEYVSPINRLSVYAGLGEWERVFDGLEQAYADHSPWLCLLKVDPRYDPIRSDARITDLLSRMGLA
jgi:serine/threonine-protein kinase